jgi:O-antigen/teichoic acid export membrane protein
MSLLKSLSWYTVTALLTSGVPFFLLPVFTHYLTQSDYGVMSSMAAYVSLLSPVVVFGIPTLFSTDFHRVDRPTLLRKSVVWMGLPFVLGSVLLIISFFGRELLAAPLTVPATWVPAIPLLALLGFIPQWTDVMLRMDNRPRSFAVYQCGQAVLMVGFALFFVVVIRMNWQGRIWSMLIAGAVASVAGFSWLRPYLALGVPAKQDVIEALKFGSGLLPHAIFSQLVRQSDRLFVLHFIGQAATGEFAVGWQVASIMLVLLSTFNQAWTPYLFERLTHADDNEKIRIVKISYVIALGFLGFFVCLNSLTTTLFSVLVSEKFKASMGYVYFITTGYLFNGMYLIVTDYIFYTKKTYILSVLTILNGATNVILNYFLVVRFGAIGVTYAFAISSFMVMVAAWILAYKVYPMPWLFWARKKASA